MRAASFLANYPCGFWVHVTLYHHGTKSGWQIASLKLSTVCGNSSTISLHSFQASEQKLRLTSIVNHAFKCPECVLLWRTNELYDAPSLYHHLAHEKSFNAFRDRESFVRDRGKGNEGGGWHSCLLTKTFKLD
jgi:hypothetical protein